MVGKKNKLGIFALTALLVLSFSLPAQAAKSFRNLSFMGGYVERHPTPVRAWTPFFKAAEEAFPGKLSFNYFSSGTLYPIAEALNAVSDGRCDIGVATPATFPGSLNLAGVIGIPGLAPNSVVGSLVLQDVIEKFPEVRAEYPANTIPFTSWSSASYQLHAFKEIKTLEDISGMKIIVWNASALETVKALGANPIRLNATDSYLALSKGMASGIYCPLAPLRSFKISEACKYHLVFNLGVDAFTMFMHKPVYDSMPPDMQKWLMDNAGMKMALECGKSLYDGELEDVKWMAEQGHWFYKPNDDERGKFLARVSSFEEDWVKQCEERGIATATARAVLTYAKERSAYHLGQMRQGTYGDYKNI